MNGSKGSIVFNLEDMNRLEYYNAEDPQESGVSFDEGTEGCHPYIAHCGRPAIRSVTRMRL